jgi:hypothetical protein
MRVGFVVALVLAAAFAARPVGVAAMWEERPPRPTDCAVRAPDFARIQDGGDRSADMAGQIVDVDAVVRLGSHGELKGIDILSHADARYTALALRILRQSRYYPAEALCISYESAFLVRLSLDVHNTHVKTAELPIDIMNAAGCERKAAIIDPLQPHVWPEQGALGKPTDAELDIHFVHGHVADVAVARSAGSAALDAVLVEAAERTAYVWPQTKCGLADVVQRFTYTMR